MVPSPTKDATPCTSPSFHGQQLNWDVLINVAPFLSTKADIFSFMLTCRAFRLPSKAALLSRPVTLSDVLGRFIGFCAFITRDPEARLASYIREITIFDYDVHGYPVEEVERISRLFGDIIRQAHNIEVLQMTYSSDFDLRENPYLSSAISSLKRIKRLVIHDAGKRVADMLAALTSPVEFADISYADSEIREYEITEPDPSILLKNFTATLTNLTVLSIPNEFPHDFHNPPIRFPNVHTLNIEGGIISDVSGFVEAFPNVSHLIVHTPEDDLTEDSDLDDWIIEPEVEVKSWSKLDLDVGLYLNGCSPAQVVEALVGFVEGLRSMPLVHLSIHLEHGLDPSYVRGLDPSSKKRARFEVEMQTLGDCLESLDLREHTRSLAESIPTLEDIIIHCEHADAERALYTSSCPADGPKLPWDVLTYMCRWFSFRTLPLVMLTCWSLYEASVPQLLIRHGQDTDCILGTLESMQSFYSFIMRQPERRSSFVRRLALMDVESYCADEDEVLETYDGIAQVLGLATNLWDLAILGADDVMKYCPRLGSVISSLPKLRHFLVSYAVAESLPTLTVPLEDADLHFSCETDEFDITHILKCSADSLVRLRLDVQVSDLDIPDSATIQFPNLRELRIVTAPAGARMDKLMRVFPGVVSFSWTDDEEAEEFDGNLETLRDGNLQRTRGAWLSLRNLYASVNNCYATAIQSRVHLWDVAGDLVRRDLRRFHIVLADLKPRALVISIGVEAFPTSGSVDLLPSSPVRYLDVNLKIEPNPNKLPVQNILDAFVANLVLHKSVIKRRIPFKERSSDRSECSNIDDDTNDTNAREQGETVVIEDLQAVDPVRDQLTAMDMEVYAAALAKNITTLKYVFIRVTYSAGSRYKRILGRYWRIARSGVSVELKAVNKDKATKLADAQLRMRSRECCPNSG
ncbi:hypothetical protein EIP91_005119 [Steccherinum ochraceum]|uniref:Uncharacterized protein n=1 Tax=Steccherinum ochraceum TaxID=92696 RepID=A0A4R0RDS1_9APHY|nr:hypothetical protein EIP91_005119 [Steccherinum ochraceum]